RQVLRDGPVDSRGHGQELLALLLAEGADQPVPDALPFRDDEEQVDERDTQTREQAFERADNGPGGAAQPFRFEQSQLIQRPFRGVGHVEGDQRCAYFFLQDLLVIRQPRDHLLGGAVDQNRAAEQPTQDHRQDQDVGQNGRYPPTNQHLVERKDQVDDEERDQEGLKDGLELFQHIQDEHEEKQAERDELNAAENCAHRDSGR